MQADIKCEYCLSTNVSLREQSTVSTRCSKKMYYRNNYICEECQKVFCKISFVNITGELLFREILRGLPNTERERYERMIL
jgi:hypothetical protein